MLLEHRTFLIEAFGCNFRFVILSVGSIIRTHLRTDSAIIIMLIAYLSS